MPHSTAHPIVRRLLFLPLVALAASAQAQSARTENTLTLDDPDRPGVGTLADVSWLIGAWEGEAFGSPFEEMWGEPSAGTMVSTFKLFSDDEVSFYEFIVISQEGETITMRLKHFTNEFVGWEEKGDYVTFPLVRVDEDAVHFRGLSYVRDGEDRVRIYLALSSDGVVREEAMEMWRRGSRR